MESRRYITYALSRFAALEAASVAIVVAGNDAGGCKDGESQHEGRKGTSEHFEFERPLG